MAAAAGPLLTVLLATLSVPTAGPGDVAVRAQGSVIALECRLARGAWQPCRMEVIEVGSHWLLFVAGRRLEFRHDGRGGVSMRRDAGSWRSVSSRWEPPQHLCWDGICARGAIPLD
ncbi:MAG: hypothetical protein VKN15_01870 [Cyanobacteriota bacterium]|nr:hypothetical protein [Cyanobacteriota bacterium]